MNTKIKLAFEEKRNEDCSLKEVCAYGCLDGAEPSDFSSYKDLSEFDGETKKAMDSLTPHVVHALEGYREVLKVNKEMVGICKRF